MKGLYFTIPAGLLLATVAVLAQDKPGPDKEPQGNLDQLLSQVVVSKPESLDQLVKQLREIRTQKQALEKQESILIEKIRAKVQEQKKVIEEIESLLDPARAVPKSEKRG
jgi:hypothetical protein